MQRFYLGIHRPNWLADADVPTFVSHRVLMARRSLPRARTAWALDSGAFTELTLHGGHTIPPAAYVASVRRYNQEIGQLDFASIQDWMCEPPMIRRTSLTVAEHITRTVDSYVDLASRAPELPWLPVVQGWRVADYLACIDEYERRGVDLTKQPVVGIGSVCKRQHTSEASGIISAMAAAGVRPHAFGFKILGLRQCSALLQSSDSMAWSYAGRRSPPIDGHTHANCANCWLFARQWYDSVLQSLNGPEQLQMRLEMAA